MDKQPELFSLIKSLTKSEKRHFKLYAKSERNVNYLRLFDEIDKQTTYNEKEIKKKFEGEKFIVQLHVTKYYLRNLILKGLRTYHSKISKSASLKDHIRNIEILYSKELYDNCAVEIKRAEEIARKYELFNSLIEIQNWKRKLEEATSPKNFNVFSAIMADQEETIKRLKNMNEYQKLAIDISSGKLFGEVNHTELLASVDLASSLQATVLHYNSIFYKNIREGNKESGKQALYKLIAQLEEQPDRIREAPEIYMSSINNLINLCIHNTNYLEAFELINRFKITYDKLNTSHENKKLLKEVLKMQNTKFEIIRRSKEYEKYKDVITQIEDFIDINMAKIPKRYLLAFWFQLGNNSFIQGDYYKAQFWSYKILNNKFRGIKADYKTHACMLNLMIQYELTDISEFQKEVENTIDYLKKFNHKITSYHKLIINAFKSLCKNSDKGQSEIFEKLREKLFDEIIDGRKEDVFFIYSEINNWLKSKIVTY